MRSKTYLVASFCALCGVAQAQEAVTTPFGLSLSPESVQILLGSIASFGSPSGEVQTQLPDQQIDSPISVALSGIHLDLKYAFAPPSPGATLNDWNLKSTSLSATLTVDQIAASEVIQETLGGTTLTATVNIQCSNATLVLAPGSTEASGTIELSLKNGARSYQLTSFTADWTPSAWQVQSLSCDGPPVVSQLVAQAAQAQLASINPFLSSIQAAIQSQLDAAASAPLVWNLGSGSSGAALSLTPSSLDFASDGSATASGTASFGFPAISDETLCGAQIAPSALPSPSAQDTLAIPSEAIAPLVQCAYNNGSLVYAFTSQQFSAFQSLLGSWFEELFVWPDLQRFPKDSVFAFDLFPYVAPALGAISQNQDGALSFDLDSGLSLSVYAPYGGSPLPLHYVDFLARVTGPASLSIQGGKALFTQSLRQLPMQAEWDPIYAEEHQPDESIWTSVIAGYVQSYLANPGLSYALPTWTQAGAFSLEAQSASVSGSDIEVGIKISTAP